MAEVVNVGEPAPQGKAVPPNQRTTLPYLTKFERARILGTRAYQLSMGAPAKVEVPGSGGPLDPLVIARKELDMGLIPIIVRRNLPDGSYEDWKLSELLQSVGNV